MVAYREKMSKLFCHGLMAALSWELRNQTVAATYGTEKSRAVTTSRKGFILDFLGITEAPWEDVEKEVTMFTTGAYNGSGTTMSECHKWLWAQKSQGHMLHLN